MLHGASPSCTRACTGSMPGCARSARDWSSSRAIPRQNCHGWPRRWAPAWSAMRATTSPPHGRARHAWRERSSAPASSCARPRPRWCRRRERSPPPAAAPTRCTARMRASGRDSTPRRRCPRRASGWRRPPSPASGPACPTCPRDSSCRRRERTPRASGSTPSCAIGSAAIPRRAISRDSTPPHGCRRTCGGEPFRAPRPCAGRVPPRCAIRRCARACGCGRASWRGATSTPSSSSITRRWRASRCGRCVCAGVATSAPSGAGRTDSPACRWSTPACASCARRASCTTVRA